MFERIELHTVDEWPSSEGLIIKQYQQSRCKFIL